jgi:hypothetical protein
VSKPLTKTLPLLAVAGLLLTGCGSTELKPTSLDEVITAWEDFTGEECTNTDRGKMVHAEASASCSSKALVSLYETPENLEKQVDAANEFSRTLDLPMTWVVGDNWAINDEDMDYDKFVDEYGGKIVDLG